MIRERFAIELMRDREHCLAQMHTRAGVRWFIIPGGEVSEETAFVPTVVLSVVPREPGVEKVKPPKRKPKKGDGDLNDAIPF